MTACCVAYPHCREQGADYCWRQVQLLSQDGICPAASPLGTRGQSELDLFGSMPAGGRNAKGVNAAGL